MVTVGLDLHKRYITACALDDAGTLLAEHRRLEPSLDALGRWLGGLPQPVRVVMEATLYWHWLERQLTVRGFQVLVAHPPYQVKLIWQARTKTDPIDARKLAGLSRNIVSVPQTEAASASPFLHVSRREAERIERNAEAPPTNREK